MPKQTRPASTDRSHGPGTDYRTRASKVQWARNAVVGSRAGALLVGFGGSSGALDCAFERNGVLT